jgi:hypothetical protein
MSQWGEKQNTAHCSGHRTGSKHCSLLSLHQIWLAIYLDCYWTRVHWFDSMSHSARPDSTWLIVYRIWLLSPEYTLSHVIMRAITWGPPSRDYCVWNSLSVNDHRLLLRLSQHWKQRILLVSIRMVVLPFLSDTIGHLSWLLVDLSSSTWLNVSVVEFHLLTAHSGLTLFDLLSIESDYWVFQSFIVMWQLRSVPHVTPLESSCVAYYPSLLFTLAATPIHTSDMIGHLSRLLFD